MKKTFLFVSILSALSNSVIANQLPDSEDEFLDFYGDEDFVSIATGTQKRIDKAPAITSLITAKDIERMGATHLDEILERVPGLHVSSSTVSRLDSVYSIRGIQTGFNPQVLVLLNGTEFKNSFSGGLPYTFRFPANIIDRIEVIRGPGTAVYGADAFSGVINIVTKDLAATNNVSAGYRRGSFNSSDAWVHAGYNNGDYKFGLAIESQKSDGDSDRLAMSDLQTNLDNLLNTRASLAPFPLQTQYDVLDIHATFEYEGFKFENWWWSQDNAGLGPGGAQVIDNKGFQDVDEYRAKLSYHSKLSETLTLDIEASYLKAENDTFFVLFPAGAKLPIGADGNLTFNSPVGVVDFVDGYIGNPRSQHEDTRINGIYNYSGIEGHQLRLEFGWFQQTLETNEYKNFGPGIIDGTQAIVNGTLTDVSGTEFVYAPNVSRTNKHITIQDVYKLSNDWELTYGFRYDDFSDFGSTTNPRIALVWDTAHNLTAKFLYGSAFRAPSFNELFLQNNPSSLGNMDLQPENIDTYELALDYQFSFDTHIAINFYSYNAKDLIDTQRVAGTAHSQTANLNTLKGRGVELEFDMQFSENLSLDANINYHATKDQTLDTQVPMVPKMTAFAGLFYDVTQDWNMSLLAHHIANRSRAQGDNRSDIGDYTLVNFSTTYYVPTINTKFSLSLKNLFDKAAFEPSNGRIQNDYALAGRSLWFSFEHSLDY